MEIGTSLESFEQAIHALEMQSVHTTDSEQKKLLEKGSAFLKNQFTIQLIKEQVARATEIEEAREYLIAYHQDIMKKMEFSFPEFESGTFSEPEPKPKMGMTKHEFQTLRDQVWMKFIERETKRKSRYEKKKSEQQRNFKNSPGYRVAKEMEQEINRFLPQLEPSWIEAQIQGELSIDDSEDLYQQILATCADRMVIEEEEAFVSEKINHKPLFSFSEEGKVELDIETYLNFLETVRTVHLNVKQEQENRDRQQKIGELEKEQEKLFIDRKKLEEKKQNLQETYQRVINEHSEDRIFQAFIGESATLPSHEGLKKLMEGFLDQLAEDKETVTTYRTLLRKLEKEKGKLFFKRKKIKIEEAERQVKIFENNHGGKEKLEHKPFNMLMSCMRIAALQTCEDRDRFTSLFYEGKMWKEDIWEKIDNDYLGASQYYKLLFEELQEVYTGPQESYDSFLEIINEFQNKVIENHDWLEEQIENLKECEQNYDLNRRSVNLEFQNYQILNEEITTELAEIDCKLGAISLQITQLEAEEITTLSEEKSVTEEDRERFTERYCTNDPDCDLSLEFITLEAVLKAQNGMLKVQDLSSNLAIHTKDIVTATINTIKEEMPIAIAKEPIAFQKTL